MMKNDVLIYEIVFKLQSTPSFSTHGPRTILCWQEHVKEFSVYAIDLNLVLYMKNDNMFISL
jgi:hypothetical protein